MLPFIAFISKRGAKCLKCIAEKKSEIISDEKYLLDIIIPALKLSLGGQG